MSAARRAGAGLARRTLLGSAAAWTALTALPSRAADAGSGYPDHPVKLVVPFPAGALTDALGRMMASGLQSALGQPFVVENRPGAGTLLGAAQVAKSAPDGYTVMVATSTTLAISPAMYDRPAATTADFEGIAMIGNVSLLLVTRADLPVATLPELVAAVRRAPGKFNFASPGTGTMHHLVIEMIKAEEGLKATHVPYQGSVAALTDLLAGRVDFMFLDAVAAMPHVMARKLRVVAVAAPQRLAELPDVAMVGEVYPGIDVHAWQAIAGPRGLSPQIVGKLNAEINKLLVTPEMRESLRRVGVQATPLSVAEVDRVIQRDAKRFGDLVRATGVRAERQ